MTTNTQEPLALDAALQLVRDERKRQDDKWGSDRAMPNALWHLILSEEVGEVAEASLGHFDGRGVDADALRRELVQVAAVAVAWIEALDRPVARDEAAELKAAIREYRAARDDYDVNDEHMSYTLDQAERLERADANLRRLVGTEGDA